MLSLDNTDAGLSVPSSIPHELVEEVSVDEYSILEDSLDGATDSAGLKQWVAMVLFTGDGDTVLIIFKGKVGIHTALGEDVASAGVRENMMC